MMISHTKKIFAGGVAIGGGAPVSVQSMTNTDTRDLNATCAQIKALCDAGCEIVRVSVYDDDCASNVRDLVDFSPVPLVADIHFRHDLAIKAVENGISKVRINPGNIGGIQNVKELADCLKAHKVPVRVGVNSGSLEKEILHKYGGVTAEGLAESALGHARLLEQCGYDNIVLSVKSSDVKMTVDACRALDKMCDYPQHIGVTEAGGVSMGGVKSAIGIGALLLDGIGDTIRVSLTGDPVNEVRAGLDILRAAGVRRDCINIISCPTCGRTRIPVLEISERVRCETTDIHKPLTVAVMGCIVNGPGEAREADLGIAGGSDGGALFIKGEPTRSIKGDLAQALIDEIRKRA